MRRSCISGSRFTQISFIALIVGLAIAVKSQSGDITKGCSWNESHQSIYWRLYLDR